MKQNDSKLNCEDVINSVVDKIETPLFFYDTPVNFDELYNKIKKHPFTLGRIINCLVLFTILVCIYFFVFWVMKKNIEFSYFHFVIIFLMFFISVFFTISIIKKNILKAVYLSEAKFYFYEDFVLIEEKDFIEMIFYNKLTYLIENKDSFVFAYDSKSFLIKKNAIDKEFFDFLDTLKNNYKKIKNSTNSQCFFDSILKELNYAKIICENNKNKMTLSLYFNIKIVRRRLFLHYLFINFIKLHLVLLLIFLFLNFYPVIKFKFSSYIYFCSLILFLTIIYMKMYNNYESNIILNDNKEKIYFFDTFIFIKSDFKFCSYSYDNVKFVEEKNGFIFIKLKSYKTPIIVNKNILNTKLLNRLKIHTI